MAGSKGTRVVAVPGERMPPVVEIEAAQYDTQDSRCMNNRAIVRAGFLFISDKGVMPGSCADNIDEPKKNYIDTLNSGDIRFRA